MKLQINENFYTIKLNDIALKRIEKDFKSFGTCDFLIKNNSFTALSKALYNCFQFKPFEKGMTFEEFLSCYPVAEETKTAFKELWGKLKEERGL